jgi:hypothetical protein
MVDWFEHSGAHGRHVCMVFEVLGDNLLTLIRWVRALVVVGGGAQVLVQLKQSVRLHIQC